MNLIGLLGVFVVEIKPILASTILFFRILNALALEFLMAWFSVEPRGMKYDALTARAPVAVGGAKCKLINTVFVWASGLSDVQLQSFA